MHDSNPYNTQYTLFITFHVSRDGVLQAYRTFVVTYYLSRGAEA